jgi:hypothetical protein
MEIHRWKVKIIVKYLLIAAADCPFQVNLKIRIKLIKFSTLYSNNENESYKSLIKPIINLYNEASHLSYLVI